MLGCCFHTCPFYLLQDCFASTKGIGVTSGLDLFVPRLFLDGQCFSANFGGELRVVEIRGIAA